MTQALEAGTGRRGLAQRLGAVAPVLLMTDAAGTAAAGASELLDQLVGAVREDLRPDRLWLLFVAVASRYPTHDELSDGMRAFELSEAMEATLWLLDCALAGATGGSAPGRPIMLVRDAVLVDVEHSAKHDLHTGIQQVVRHLLPRWVQEHDVIPVVWTSRYGAHRALSPPELRRVLTWGEARPETRPDDEVDEDEEDGDTPLLVPWHCIVVMAEVPFGEAPQRLSPLAQSSGNHLVAIGYDCIPVVSADLVPTADSNRFVNYLSVIKQASRVAGISASATVEFQGFVDTLPTQGLGGPAVIECMLPSTPDSAGPPRRVTPRQRPVVLVVGSFEPRKNHLGVLHAAEKMWRSGLEFELMFIGGSGWGTELPDRMAELKAAGRPLTVPQNVDMTALQLAYRSARFSVFPSKHEGFGLPVAESLATGTPVITSDFGSMRELASDGGVLMVDPHDDGALEHAMRSLLTDDGTLEELRTQIASRPVHDWDDYARQLWAMLIVPLLAPDGVPEPP